MLSGENLSHIKKFRIKPGKKVRLKDYDTTYTGGILTKEEGIQLLEESRKALAEIQDKLYAQNHYSVLIIFQAMDAGGKDGAVKHIMSGFNPMGVKVYSFKAPTAAELDHDYIWRHYIALPARGEIAIHNRSHYENVLVTRVHPEYILGERLPGIDSVGKIDDTFWEERFRQINRFEKNITSNGTLVLKFFLHLSRKEQKKRFMERIDDPTKNWKFSVADLAERAHWTAYQRAYEAAIAETSTAHAPWFVIPADTKWFTRVAIATIIHDQLERLDINYPKLDDKQKEELEKARTILTGASENDEKKVAKKKKKA